MKYYLDKTVHSTQRLYIYRPTAHVIAIMELLCIWGGTDKQGADYMSWELPIYLTSGYIDMVMSRLSIYSSTSYDWIN